jgi:hypothetical protein
VGDFEEEIMEEMAEIYSLVMARSRLDWRTPDKEIRRASSSAVLWIRDLYLFYQKLLLTYP